MLNQKPAGQGAAFAPLPCAANGAADMGKGNTQETGGAGLPMVAGVERLRRVCDILQCDFSVAFNTCENDILARGDVAARLVEIINIEAAFDDCGIDRELRRIAPLAIAERHEKLNAHFGVHNAAPEITEADIEEFINDFGAEETSLARVRLFGDLGGTEIKYIDDPQEIRARKTAYIVKWDTRELRRTIGQWLYYSRAESIADLAGELRRECSAKNWQDERLDVIADFVTLARVREIAFIAQAESRRAESAHGRHGRTADASGGAANPSGNTGGGVVINAPVVNIHAGKVETPAPKEKPAGHNKGFSQADFAALLKHYGGRFDGMPYKKRAIKEWDANPKKRPMAGGVRYSPDLRRDIVAARVWADNFNREKQAALNARARGLGRIRRG